MAGGRTGWAEIPRCAGVRVRPGAAGHGCQVRGRDNKTDAGVHEGAPGIAGVRVAEVPAPRPGPGEVLVRLTAAGLNHWDLSTMDSRGPADPSTVLGSDGAGIVVAAGADAAVEAGAEVVVNPSLDWAEPDVVPEIPAILGMPTNGTLAGYVVVPAGNVVPKPGHLSWTEAAALPLAALTAYRALFTRAG